jgi:uncharacterized protein
VIGLVSDTHDNARAIERATEHFRARRPSIILHLGDITTPSTLGIFEGLPLRFVFGNNDRAREALREQSHRMGFGEPDDLVQLEIEGKRICMYHGTDSGEVTRLAESARYDYLLVGHTHRRRDEHRGTTRIINPGALYRTRNKTIAFLEPVSGTLEFVDIENP